MNDTVRRMRSIAAIASCMVALLGGGACLAKDLSGMPQAGRFGTGNPPAAVVEPMVPEPLAEPRMDPAPPISSEPARQATDVAELARRCQAGNTEACAALADRPDANTGPLTPR